MKIIKQLTAACLAVMLVCLLCSCMSSEISIGSESQTETTVQPSKPPKKHVKKSEKFTHAYNCLDDIEKELYNKIGEYAQMRICVPFKVNGEATERQMRTALDGYKNDHPEVFWLSSKYSYFHNNGETTFYIFFNNNMSVDERMVAKTEFDAVVNKIVANAPKNASDYEIELYVNNYIIENCRYDHEAAEAEEPQGNANDAYGALVDGSAVCEGYARAFQLLCTKLGIDCVMVYGINDNVPHAWNCARISGEWCQVDTTNNDAEEYFNVNAYLNLCDEQMYAFSELSPFVGEVSDEQIHDKSFNFYVPKCTSTKYNYYRNTFCVISNVDDKEEAVKEIADAALDGEEYAVFLVDDNLNFEDTLYTLTDGTLSMWIDEANKLNDDTPKLNVQGSVNYVDKTRIIALELNYI